MCAKRPENLGDRKQGNLQGENSYSKCRKDKICFKKKEFSGPQIPPPLHSSRKHHWSVFYLVYGVWSEIQKLLSKRGLKEYSLYSPH